MLCIFFVGGGDLFDKGGERGGGVGTPPPVWSISPGKDVGIISPEEFIGPMGRHLKKRDGVLALIGEGSGENKPGSC